MSGLLAPAGAAVCITGAALACGTATAPVPVEIHLPALSIQLEPSRADISVSAVWIQVRCIRAAGGSRQDTCEEFTINGVPIDRTVLLDLEAGEPNRVELPPHDFAFSPRDGGHLCFAVRAVFNEVSHREDVEIFERTGDRYSLISFCTVAELPAWVDNRHVFEQNRVATLEEFIDRLSRPIEIRLRPESPENDSGDLSPPGGSAALRTASGSGS